jgi:hypothetical protein
LCSILFQLAVQQKQQKVLECISYHGRTDAVVESQPRIGIEQEPKEGTSTTTTPSPRNKKKYNPLAFHSKEEFDVFVEGGVVTGMSSSQEKDEEGNGPVTAQSSFSKGHVILDQLLYPEGSPAAAAAVAATTTTTPASSTTGSEYCKYDKNIFYQYFSSSFFGVSLLFQHPKSSLSMLECANVNAEKKIAEFINGANRPNFLRHLSEQRWSNRLINKLTVTRMMWQVATILECIRFTRSGRLSEALIETYISFIWGRENEAITSFTKF